jgi:hypothetical protein
MTTCCTKLFCAEEGSGIEIVTRSDGREHGRGLSPKNERGLPPKNDGES